MNKGYFISQINKHHSPSNPTMIFSDGTILSHQDIINTYTSFKEFCETNSIDSSSRIGVFLQQPKYYFPIGLSVLECACLVQLEIESIEDLKKDISNYHLDYILLDTLNDYSQLEEVGIILYQNNEFTLDKISQTKKSEYHSNRIAYLSKTSGTSSTPKIVPIEYDTMVFKQTMNIEHFNLDEHIVQLQTSKMSRFVNLSNALRVISKGGIVLQTDGIKVKEIISFLTRYPVNYLVIVPAGIKQLLDYLDELKEDNLIRNCVLIIGGSKLDPTLGTRIQAHQATVVSYYGMTETGSIASSYQTPKGYKEGSVGWAKIDCKIIDDEICVTGPAVFKGYENIDNNNYFIDEWFKTGDIGYLDADNYLFITGRKSEMINRNGEKISPYELESQLLKHPSIKEVVIYPRIRNHTEEVACAIVLEEGKTINLTQIREFLSGKVNAYKMPTELIIIKEIPLSDKDKIQRKQLQTIFDKQGIKPEIMEEIIEKLTPIEKRIQSCFKQVLQDNTIQLDDDFFIVGGDSLKANELIVLIEKTFKIDLPMDYFLQNRTIRGCAKLIQSKNITSSKYLIPLNQNQSDITLVCVHSGDGSAINFHYLAKQTSLKCLAYDINTKRMHDLNPQSLKELVQFYKQEIEERIDGKIILVGDCVGGVIAYELATQLLHSRIEVLHCILLDSLNGNRKSSKNSFSSSFTFKLKRNINKIRELSLNEQLNHIKQAIPKMLSYIQAYIEKRLLKNDPQKWIKFLNHRTIIYYFIRQYKVLPYPKSLIYVQSKNQKDEHVEYWRNINPSMKVIPFECKHDEFLNKNEVKDLSILIDSLIQ